MNLIIEHLLKLHASPDDQATSHWRSEIVGFQRDLKRRFSPSMQQRINLADLYIDAVDQLRAGDPFINLPRQNPFTLDELRSGDLDLLLACFPPPV